MLGLWFFVCDFFGGVKPLLTNFNMISYLCTLHSGTSDALDLKTVNRLNILFPIVILKPKHAAVTKVFIPHAISPASKIF